MLGVIVIGTRLPEPVLPVSMPSRAGLLATRLGVSPAGIIQACSPVFMSMAVMRL